MSDVPSAKLVLLKDLKDYNVGDSVRITGIWVELGIIEFEQVRVEIDLAKVEQKLPVKGELVQCLGEIKSNVNNTYCISARILRSVNTLDMELYEKVVHLINK